MRQGSRGNALCEGQDWCQKGCTTRTTLLHFVALSGVASLRADGKLTCTADFWRQPPPILVHFRAHGLLHSCAACKLSERHTNISTAVSIIGHHKSCSICQSCCSRLSLMF